MPSAPLTLFCDSVLLSMKTDANVLQKVISKKA